MKVLVTGVSGYIGGQTALQLNDQGHEVYGLDIRPMPKNLIKVGPVKEFLQDNFGNDSSLNWIAEHNFDAIVHCAGTSLVGPSMMNPLTYYANNYIRTQRMCDYLMLRKWTGRLIFSSSAATYGNPIITPAKEVDPAEPISPYGESKLMVEWMLKSYHRAYDFDFVAFRYFNACGADPQARHGQEPGATHIIARLIESAQTGTHFICNGNDYDTDDGTCVRDYVHVSDIAHAHITALDSSVVPVGVYNLGTATGASNLEVVDAVRGVTHLPINVEFGPKRDGDPAQLTADSGKFKDVSGWEPKYSLHDIAQHAWNWYEAQSV